MRLRRLMSASVRPSHSPLNANLSYARCPRCGGALPIKVLWDFSRHSRFDLIGRYWDSDSANRHCFQLRY